MKKNKEQTCVDCLQKPATVVRHYTYQCSDCADKQDGIIVEKFEVQKSPVCLHEKTYFIPVVFSDGTKHVGEYCVNKECGKWLKWQAQEVAIQDVFFPFGKYKNKKYVEIARANPEYFQWLILQPMCKKRMRDLIEQALRFVKSR